MGRLFLQDLRRTPEKPYYVCAACQNHLGFLDDYIWYPWVSEAYRYLYKLVNVVIDGPAHYVSPAPIHFFPIHPKSKIPHYVLADQEYQNPDIHCVRCSTLLGYKIGDGVAGVHFMDVAKLQVKIGDNVEPATDDLQYRPHF